ncbi:MAG TPA: hypothetical protein PKA88_17230 [Polyangiaceae bacterium]|nr:hypothetical protein [Polyangiaceae bacterium]
MSQFVVATRKGLFVLNAQTHAICRSAFLGDPVTAVLSDPRDGVLWAAVGHGHAGAKLFSSKNAGETFVETAAPQYPKKPEGLDDKDPVHGTDVPWKVEQIWCLEAGRITEPGVLYAGTIPGGFFTTRDSGDSWELCESLWLSDARKQWFGGGYDHPGIHSICVDPRQDKALTIGVSCGGVWHSADGAKTFQSRSKGMWAADVPEERKQDDAIQDPHRIVRCSAEPKVLWCQHHNGVFRSEDDGLNWTELTNVPPSSFGFAVAAHPKDPLAAWFVPLDSDSRRMPVDGKVVVARTRDGGKSFDVLTEGLPQSDAFDVVYRHALDVSPDGDTLVMGSTTGSLFISNDAGDSWHSLHHLPPIYAVRYWH